MRAFWIAVALLAATAATARSATPVALDERLKIDLVAQHPQIVTPTGIACDVRDNVWVIESNTHFRPKDYKGHPTDRIWVFQGLSGDLDGHDPGTRQQILFADGFQLAMSLTLTAEGNVYVVCRNEIVFLQDRDRDLKPDRWGETNGVQQTLVKLVTDATYPHNGLNGAVLSPDGQYLYFCLGLNAGYDYTVVGSDGSKVSGGGEGGSIWRCTRDGRNVERIATGFWNCHDLTFDAFGRLFAVDNDPDDIGPCRLLDIVEGGDYGWKFKNGRKGTHPFTSWNGELPGTLPMVAPTGEAPSGILAYESDGLPADYRGQLLVTSWGDHIIQRFRLEDKGATFTSKPVNIIRGGDDFRPVGIAQSADGSVFVSDWVDKSYPVHGKGRLWRVRPKEQLPKEPSGSAAGEAPRADDIQTLKHGRQTALLDHPARMIRESAAQALVAEADVKQLKAYLESPAATRRGRLQLLWAADRNPKLFASVFERSAPEAAIGLMKDFGGPMYAMRLRTASASTDAERLGAIALCGCSDAHVSAAAVGRLSAERFVPSLIGYMGEHDSFGQVLALRQINSPDARSVLPKMLKSDREWVRRAALQWIGEDRLTQFKDDLPATLKAGDVTPDLLATYLACQEKLATKPPEPGKPPAETSGQQFAVAFLRDESNDPAQRRAALPLIDPADPKIPAKTLIGLIDTAGVEAVKALAWRDDAESQAALRRFAADPAKWPGDRVEAIAGLARSASTVETQHVLSKLLRDPPPSVPFDFSRSFPDLKLAAVQSLRGYMTADDARFAFSGPHREAMQDRSGDPGILWSDELLLSIRGLPNDVLRQERDTLAREFEGNRPRDVAGWQAVAARGGDPESGRRVFSRATGARCYVCHTVDHRGGSVGPDLTRVGLAMDRDKIVESILEPSKEVAPLYVSTVIETRLGDVFSGVLQNEPGANWVSLADATGVRHRIRAEEVVSRRTEEQSLMPNALIDSLTVQEFRDLVAYLSRGSIAQ